MRCLYCHETTDWASVACPFCGLPFQNAAPVPKEETAEAGPADAGPTASPAVPAVSRVGRIFSAFRLPPSGAPSPLGLAGATLLGLSLGGAVGWAVVASTLAEQGPVGHSAPAAEALSQRQSEGAPRQLASAGADLPFLPGVRLAAGDEVWNFRPRAARPTRVTAPAPAAPGVVIPPPHRLAEAPLRASAPQYITYFYLHPTVQEVREEETPGASVPTADAGPPAAREGE